MPRACERCTFCAYSSSGRNGSVGGSVTFATTPAPGVYEKRIATRLGCDVSSSLMLARMVISSSPALIVSGAMRRTIAGHTVCGDVEHRPHVKHDAVVVEPPLAPLGLRAANAVETRREGALNGRDPDHLAGLVQLGGHITDLGQRDEPLIGRILLGHHVEEVRACRGGQPSAVEVLQPPQIEALPGERVHVADGQVLRHATVLRRTERHLMQLAADHRHGHPAPTGRAGVRGKHITQRGGQFVAVGGRVRPGQIDVDNEVVSLGSGDCVDGVAALPTTARGLSPSIPDAAAVRPIRNCR